jgi:hypothetical protein
MKCGELPHLVIRSLERISPSRFVALQECVLRELWASSGSGRLLPLNPRARLGTVIHRLLQDVGSGNIPSSAESLESVFDRLVSEAETSMSQSWIDRSLVPLRRTVADFEVQKLRALECAARIKKVGTRYEHKLDVSPAIGCEIWVQSEDGSVGGFIDSVYEHDWTVVVRDYKTGLIMGGTSESEPNPSKEYLVQIKLYAALYHEKFNDWPAFAELVPLQGEPIRIVVEPEECWAILQKAKETLHAVNALIVRASSRDSELSESLATPTSSNCRKCLSRPACQSYQKACVKEDSEWPADVWGAFVSQQSLGNGRSLIKVSDGNQVITVRQITSSRERHPALESLEAGDRVGIYNVRFNSTHTDATETNATTIYRSS